MELKLEDIEAVYHAALEIKSGPERDAFLETACGNNTVLRTQVTGLLETSEETGNFLESPVFCPNDIPLDSLPTAEGPGSYIGPYKLLEQIGEGGMAVVYMAVQERPLQRRVALKIIKLGMDTKQVIARFEAERQVLAMMDHPNIARVFDAGTTDNGRPYFVMELVRGISITKYCDQHTLSTMDRLELFVPICNAVHHAHQKGVIHRDLKPSNIMVTMHDGNPVPKVIDFGIAKATNQRLTEHTIFTRYAEMIGTPEYMSPEQAEMSELDIDTRTDIYSLGIVLYELLIGTLPFDGDTLRSAAIGEIQRIIREQEPPRPSTRLSSLGKAAEEIAKRRRTNITGLARRLNRELEWIPMMAMRKDRTRRYRSASEFADDITNYLSGAPLIAGPESAWYRLTKLAQKHRVVFMATVAVILSLIIGLAVSSHLFLKAQRALTDLNQLEARVEADEIFAGVQDLRARGRYKEGLEALEPHLSTQNLGPQTQLLYAQLLFDMGRVPEARDRLNALTSAPPAIAGSAHYLLARMALQDDPDGAEEHQQLAESLLPQTVEAYTLRAMTVINPEEALQWLSKALEIDPGHYASRKARALAYYHLKKYPAMTEDVGILIALRQDDYLGYALRAIVRREAGAFEAALKDHTRALETCPLKTDVGELYYQRWQTYMRSGAYQAALIDAKRYTSLQPNASRTKRYPVFYTLLALQEYQAAQKEHQRIVKQDGWAQHHVKQDMVKYRFDLLKTDRDIQFPTDVSRRSPFNMMEQAADFYRLLEKKGRRISIPHGAWLGSWSPDARQIAYDRGGGNSWRAGTLHESVSQGFSNGVELLNVNTGDTRLLCAEGKGPVWSPDGRHIAFQKYPEKREEIWLVPSVGGMPRRIASGFILNWSQDAKLLYYWGESGNTIYAVDITLSKTAGVPVMECKNNFRARSKLSPDNRHIALNELSDVRVLTFPEGREVARWQKPWPLQWVSFNWHPDGTQILLNASWHLGDMGMCVFDLKKNETLHVFNLNGPKCQVILSLDGTRLIVVVMGAAQKCWSLDIDPEKPLAEILAPALTEEQLLVRLLDQYDRIIASDTPSANHYLSRALVFFARQDVNKARQDMEQCVNLIQTPNGPTATNLQIWVNRYLKSKRHTEAEILTLNLAQLAERFPKRFHILSPQFNHPFQQLVEIYTALEDQQQAVTWQKKWQHIQGASDSEY